MLALKFCPKSGVCGLVGKICSWEEADLGSGLYFLVAFQSVLNPKYGLGLSEEST